MENKKNLEKVIDEFSFYLDEIRVVLTLESKERFKTPTLYERIYNKDKVMIKENEYTSDDSYLKFYETARKYMREINDK